MSANNKIKLKQLDSNDIETKFATKTYVNNKLSQSSQSLKIVFDDEPPNDTNSIWIYRPSALINPPGSIPEEDI